MSVVAIREVTPMTGKEELVESRMKRAAEIVTKHGAQTRLWRVAAGQGASDYIMMSMYETFAKGAIAFQNFMSDPAITRHNLVTKFVISLTTCEVTQTHNKS